MKWTQVTAGEINAANQRLWVAIGDNAEEVATRINTDHEFVANIARLMVKVAYRPFVPGYTSAKSILGADFITPEEVMEARPSIVYTDEQITALAESLPTEDMLKWCKDNGYAVMPAPPTAMSTLDVREIQSVHFHSKTGGWYSDQKFAREDKTSFGWLMIKKIPVQNSTSKTWNEQCKLRSALEKVPNVAEMGWFITTYFEVRGIRLFEGVNVRTSSLDSGGHRVIVGYFDSMGLFVHYWGDDGRDDNVGLSGARKQ